MQKVVVTGGCGFIGSHLAQTLCAEHYDVTVIDNFTTGSRHHLDVKSIRVIEGDIRDRALLKQALQGVDIVFHLAAKISVSESIQNPTSYIESNCLGTITVLEACRDAAVAHIILASSAAIYGNNATIPTRENMPPAPTSPYAQSKLDGEFYCQLFQQEYGIHAAILRYFNVYGPRQNPLSAYAAAIPIFIRQALHNEDIVIFGNGEQTRDFIYVQDVVAASLIAAKNAGDIYNVANNIPISINQLVNTIIQLTHSRSKIIYQAERAGDIKHSQASIQKLHDLGFKPEYDLTRGLMETIAKSE